MTRISQLIWLTVLLAALAFTKLVIIPVFKELFYYPSRGYFVEFGNVYWTRVASIADGKLYDRRIVLLEEADASTFRVIDPPSIAVDKTFVFVSGQILPGRDGSTYKKLDEFGRYWSDKNSVYSGSRKLEGADPTTFTILPRHGLARDDDQLFFFGSGIVPCDIASFRILEPGVISPWWRDDLCIYKGPFPLKFADPDSFEVLTVDHAKDKHSVIWGYGRPVRARQVDLDTVEAVDLHTIRDQSGCYQRNKLQSCPTEQ